MLRYYGKPLFSLDNKVKFGAIKFEVIFCVTKRDVSTLAEIYDACTFLTNRI